MIRGILTKTFVLAALVAAFTLVPSAKAEATFMAFICQNQFCAGGTVVSAIDEGAGDAAPGIPGLIGMFAVGVGGLTTTSNISLSKPAVPDPELDLQFGASGVGAVWFYATDTNYVLSAPLFGTIGGTISCGTCGSDVFATDPGGQVIASVYGGSSNAQFPTAPPLATTGVLSGNPFSAAFGPGLPTTSPYSYTLELYIKRTVAGSTTGDVNTTTPIPEPASMTLLGLGLSGLGAAYRRRRARAKA